MDVEGQQESHYSVNSMESVSKLVDENGLPNDNYGAMFEGNHASALASMNDNQYAKKFVNIFFYVSVFAGVVLVSLVIASLILAARDSKRLLPFTQYDKTFKMNDGTFLSATITEPLSGDILRPVILEYTSQRKDDVSTLQNWKTSSFFAQRGFIHVSVDVRGTGSSGGKRPIYPFSKQEIEDGVKLVEMLASTKWLRNSNGNVGLLGIGMSATRALLVARENPKQLGAVMALHASDNLFFNGFYPDGGLHEGLDNLLDDHFSVLPKSLDYNITQDGLDQFMEQRFDILKNKPWMFNYLEHQINDEFWEEKSIIANVSTFKVPVYLIGGLYDSNRDFVLRLYEKLAPKVSKVKVVLGPYSSTWPDDSELGPVYNGRQEAVYWFKQWLADEDNGYLREPDVSMFSRQPFKPFNPTSRQYQSNIILNRAQEIEILNNLEGLQTRRDDIGEETSNIETSSPSILSGPNGMDGSWRYEGWPIDRTIFKKYYLLSNKALSPEFVHQNVQPDQIAYKPTSGIELRSRWGQITGDMSKFDQNSLVYTTETIDSAFEINGFVSVSLRVMVNTTQANWIVRLEDVHPDGAVSLITGSGINSAFSLNATNPSNPVPGEFWTMTAQLHYTTWNFLPGHKIRLAISNSAPGLQWNSPLAFTSSVKVSDLLSWIELPIVPPAVGRRVRVPSFTKIGSNSVMNAPDGFQYNRTLQLEQSLISSIPTSDARQLDYFSSLGNYINANDRVIITFAGEKMSVQDDVPANVTWTAQAQQIIVINVGSGTPDSPPGEPGPYLLDLLGEYENQYSYLNTTSYTVKGVPAGHKLPNVALNKFRWLLLNTQVTLQSDERNFYATMMHNLTTSDNGQLPVQKLSGSYERRFH